MKEVHLLLASTCLTLLVSLPAGAQVPPFFNSNPGIFDPEISVVQSGVLLDAQAVVSADRKYVTMTTRLQNAQLLNLSEFAFQTGGGAVPAGQVGGGGGVAGGAAQGNVGARGAAGADAAAGSAGRGSARTQHPPSAKSYPVPGKPFPSDGKSVLDREGMTLVGRVYVRPDDLRGGAAGEPAR